MRYSCSIQPRPLYIILYCFSNPVSLCYAASCQFESSWTACSVTCGIGVSFKLSYNNGYCMPTEVSDVIRFSLSRNLMWQGDTLYKYINNHQNVVKHVHLQFFIQIQQNFFSYDYSEVYFFNCLSLRPTYLTRPTSPHGLNRYQLNTLLDSRIY